MSKAISEAAILKPEYRLIQAISDFEAQLSSQQKILFGKEKQIVPSADDVMRFTAKIDKDISARGIRRVYGPRLTNFLDGVQKFVPLGDILIGTTPGMLGRGIWTVVRFSITAALGSSNQHSSYIDKLSSIFMEAGRSIPRYNNMALLFPQSKKLQANLTEYYIIVVKLCHKILQTSQSSSFMQLWDSFSDPLQTFQSQLKTWSTAIKDELLIQSIAMTKEEKDDSSRFRLALQKDRMDKEIRRKHKMQIRILDQCSKYDHVTTWKQTRKIGNTRLFANDLAYRNWKTSSVSSTLVYCGKLGAGKSVLLANIVDDLFLELKPDSYCITYFFCDHENKQSLKARTILGSFTRQILQLHYSLDKISELNRDSLWNSDSIPSISDFLDEGFTRAIYFVLDGLDECEIEQRDQVFSAVKALQKKFKLLLCVSSRLEPDRASKFESHQLVAPNFSDIPEDNPEIADFIDCEIKACISSGQLKIMDREIIPTIKEVLLLGAQGMFLWVSLSIKTLWGLPSDNDILEALANLPQKLTDTYMAILEKSPDSHKTYLNLVLQLMVVAIRPLSMKELRVALNVRPGEMEWNASTLVTDMLDLLTSSGGLVIVDEEMYTVRFVHHSLRQFLTDPTAGGSYSFLLSDAERYMAQVLTTYLNHMCFDTRLSTAVAPKIDGAPLISNILGSFGAIGRLVNKSHKGPDLDIGRILIEASIRSKSRQKTDLSLESYARKFWCQHSATVLDIDSLVLDLVHKLIEKDHKFILDPSHVQNPLSWTVENGYSEAHRLLLEGGPKLDGFDLFQRMLIAAQKGEEEIVKIYLKNASVVACIDDYDNSCLPKSKWRFMLLQSAIQSNQADVVKLLLRQKDTTADILDYCLAAVNQYAFYGHRPQFGDFAVMEAIVDSLILNPSRQFEFFLLIETGVRTGQTDLVELLLSYKGFCLKALDHHGSLLLGIAVMEGYTRIVEVLLSTGKIDIEKKDKLSGKTPLILASKNRYIEIARMLLAISYDRIMEVINAVDDIGRTALLYAAGNGDVRMMKLLIESSNDSLDVRIRDRDGRSALSYAAAFGAQEPIEILLSLQNNTWYEVDIDNWTPLQHCSRNRHHDPAAASLLRATMRNSPRPT